LVVGVVELPAIDLDDEPLSDEEVDPADALDPALRLERDAVAPQPQPKERLDSRPGRWVVQLEHGFSAGTGLVSDCLDLGRGQELSLDHRIGEHDRDVTAEVAHRHEERGRDVIARVRAALDKVALEHVQAGAALRRPDAVSTHMVVDFDAAVDHAPFSQAHRDAAGLGHPGTPKFQGRGPREHAPRLHRGHHVRVCIWRRPPTLAYLDELPGPRKAANIAVREP
jgi:hypothetical protein